VKEEVLIFANPIAGRGMGKLAAQKIEQELHMAGFTVQTLLEPPTEIAPSSINHSAVAAISIGGDGTLRQVAKVLLAGGQNPPPLLPIPMGTANLMARHLNFSGELEAITATVLRRKIIKLDAGLANGELFLLVAGAGIDGQVVHLLDEMRSGPIKLASYVLPMVLTLRDYKFPAISIVVDGKTVTQDRPAIVFIGNVKEYGTGFPILIDAKPDDGLLDVCVLPCRDYRDLAEMLMLAAAGEHRAREDVIYVRGQSIDIRSINAVAVQIDGEAAGFTPLHITVLPASVPFLIPA
jgi:diacylglycerol kinase (ATP)